MNKFEFEKLSFYTGIDISKNKIDFAVVQSSSTLVNGRVANNESGFEEMIAILMGKEINPSENLFCMEATGIYSNPLLNFLIKNKLFVSVEHPIKIKNASGIVRNKSDSLDAQRIAAYAQRYKDVLKPWIPKRPVISHLQHLSSLRARLVVMQGSFKAIIKEQNAFLSEEVMRSQHLLNESARKALETEIARVDKTIGKFIKKDKSIQEMTNIMTSIPGIGPVTALEVLIATNEFKTISCPKKFASYAGIAPFVKESGTKKSVPKISKQSDRRLKSLLTTCAFAAITHVPDLKAYYRRKTIEEKKPSMSVINAVRFKLILRIFCCVTNKRYFNPDYKSSFARNQKITSDRD